MFALHYVLREPYLPFHLTLDVNLVLVGGFAEGSIKDIAFFGSRHSSLKVYCDTSLWVLCDAERTFDQVCDITISIQAQAQTCCLHRERVSSTCQLRPGLIDLERGRRKSRCTESTGVLLDARHHRTSICRLFNIEYGSRS